MDKKKLNFDWFLLIICITATVYGIVMISDIVSDFSNPSRYVGMQIAALALGVAAVFVITRIDHEVFGLWSYVIYAVTILPLVAVLLMGAGATETGTSRWFRLGFIVFQPSEIAKIGFIITFAQHAQSVKADINRVKNVAGLLAHAGVLIVLVLLQPDFGTAMVFTFVMIGILFFSGISYKYIFGAIPVIGVVAPIIWFFVLKPFQRNRVLTFLNPELDLSGRGYQVAQSKIAIGSGQVTGKGMFSASTTVIPEKHNDFIFAAIGENLGFIGTIIVLILLVAIILRIFYIAQNARDDYGELLCIGVGCMLSFHILENVCMCIGLMPVTGIPLPFFSYGGTNLLANYVAIALVLAVSTKKKSRN